LVSVLATVAEFEALPSAVLASLHRTLGWAEVGWLALKDQATGQYHPAAALGYDLAQLRDLELQPSEALPGCDEAGPPCLHPSAEAIAAALGGLRPETRATLERVLPPNLVVRSLAVVPLHVPERTVGALWVGSVLGEIGVSAVDVPLLQHLGGLIGLALDRAQRVASPALPDPDGQAGQVRSEALATLSHELRTPLATIKGYATALLLEEAEWSAEEQREFLTLIDRECDTLQAMIGEVLDSALIDAGHLGIEPEPVRLPHLAHQVADEVQRQTTVHRLVDDFPADFPLLTADPRRLRQVLRNILDNAVKYSPAGGLIVIRGEVRPADVVISVADQGVGIAPEDLIPLFDKYFRVKSAAGSHVPGTGLGLPVTRAIVEAHGGRIWAESKLGHGTTFYFSLPRDDRALLESD
jgi:signal transduction histidine kinase